MGKRTKFETYIENIYDDLRSFNYTLSAITVPEFLGKLPLAIAILLWVAFSLFWIAIAGPICFIVEAVTVLTIFFAGILSGRFSGRTKIYSEFSYIVQLALCYIALRFVACADIFSDAILRRRYYQH